MIINKSKRGFAVMNPEKQRALASLGGKQAHVLGKGHEFTSEEAREAGKRGGKSRSADRKAMSEIGRKGGLASRANARKQENKEVDEGGII